MCQRPRAARGAAFFNFFRELDCPLTRAMTARERKERRLLASLRAQRDRAGERARPLAHRVAVVAALDHP